MHKLSHSFVNKKPLRNDTATKEKKGKAPRAPGSQQSLGERLKAQLVYKSEKPSAVSPIAGPLFGPIEHPQRASLTESVVGQSLAESRADGSLSESVVDSFDADVPLAVHKPLPTHSWSEEPPAYTAFCDERKRLVVENKRLRGLLEAGPGAPANKGNRVMLKKQRLYNREKRLQLAQVVETGLVGQLIWKDLGPQQQQDILSVEWNPMSDAGAAAAYEARGLGGLSPHQLRWMCQSAIGHAYEDYLDRHEDSASEHSVPEELNAPPQE